MRHLWRVVIDTNCLISRLLLPHSTPGQAVRKAMASGLVLVSESTLHELADVLAREKFDRYLTLDERQRFLRLLGRVSEVVPILRRVRECRDESDDKFLEVALNGRAQLLLTGDADLLSLYPWHDIRILSPAVYLQEE